MKISISKNNSFICQIPNVDKISSQVIERIHYINVHLTGAKDPIAFCECEFTIEEELPWDRPDFINVEHSAGPKKNTTYK